MLKIGGILRVVKSLKAQFSIVKSQIEGGFLKEAPVGIEFWGHLGSRGQREREDDVYIPSLTD